MALGARLFWRRGNGQGQAGQRRGLGQAPGQVHPDARERDDGAGADDYYEYDVFLSFRGSDVRKGLVDHMYWTFTRAGIRTFLDSRSLTRGRPIGPSLENAIRRSRVRIPVFSTNYAESDWCLRELALIMASERASNVTIPLFYNVTPSNVRHPESLDGGPMFEHMQTHLAQRIHPCNDIMQWQRALFASSLLSGWKLSDFDGHEGQLVTKVLEDVLRVLQSGSFDDPAKQPQLQQQQQPQGLPSVKHRLDE